MREPVIHNKRFDEKWMPEPMSGCWLWIRSTDSAGYGLFWDRDRHRGAHRVAYERWVGPIPAGLHLDHLCRTPACINPEHLEAVTPRESTLRGHSKMARNAKQTDCLRGHEFTPANTLRSALGTRYCRACHNARQRRVRAAKAGAR
jgi:hypothetical protein